MRALVVAGLFAVLTALVVLGVVIAVDRSDRSEGAVAFDAGSEVPGELDCEAITDLLLEWSLAYLEQAVDPLAVPPDVDLEPIDLIAEDLPAGCDLAEVRRTTYERLLPAAIDRFGEDGIARRTTALTALTIAFNAEQFGLGYADPTPIPTRSATDPPLQATPIPTEGPAATWCGQTGLVGAVVSTATALEALCADGSRVPIATADGWESVDIGGTRLVAANRDPGTGAATITEFALAGGAAFGTSPGHAPALSPDGRLAWIQPDGTIAVDGLAGGPLTPPTPVDQLSWDRDGRWLFARTETEPGTVTAFDTATAAATPTMVAADGVVAMAGEVDTPGNVVFLTTDEQTVTPRAAFVGQGDPAAPFDLASTGLAATTFGQGAFVEPVGLRRVDPAAAPAVWAQGSRIGWVVGDGTAAWYLDGTSETAIGDDIRDLAIIP